MAWLGKVSLGGFPDLAGAVTKLSESVKNIEKNFDSALGLEDQNVSIEASRQWSSSSQTKALLDPVMAFIGHGDEETAGHSERNISVRSENEPGGTSHDRLAPSIEQISGDNPEVLKPEKDVHLQMTDIVSAELKKNDEEEGDPGPLLEEAESYPLHSQQATTVVVLSQGNGALEIGSDGQSESGELSVPVIGHAEHILFVPDEPLISHDQQESKIVHNDYEEQLLDKALSKIDDADPTSDNAILNVETEVCHSTPVVAVQENNDEQSIFGQFVTAIMNNDTTNYISDEIASSNEKIVTNPEAVDETADNSDHFLSSPADLHTSDDSSTEMKKLRKEMRMLELALQAAARQAQAKADEIARLMNEVEQLKSVNQDLKRKHEESELDALREEYHQKVASLERKVYALSKERDTLRREQSKKSDAAALLKEKDEIIKQVMAEGEELSKKQAAQELQIRKLRAQVRELEEEKQRLNSKIQVEETKVESIRKDKVATEKLLQETIEKNEAELLSQKEYYANALNAAKDAEALAEARVNNELRAELENRLREAEEKEATLIQALDELRLTLTRTEQQAAFREDMLRREIDDLQKRCQASELRCEELVTQFPESTRPLLRQIEAIRESSARKAEAWAGVELELNLHVQEAESRAAAAVEKERAMNERLSQTLSRMAVIEAQVSCLRAELAQLSRSLEKERQRAAENRQEYLAAKEAAATHEVHVKQLEEELEFKSKQLYSLQQELSHKELLEKDMESRRNARLNLDNVDCHEPSASEANIRSSSTENEHLSAAGSISSEKCRSEGRISIADSGSSLLLSMDASENLMLKRTVSSETISSFPFKLTTAAFEAILRQKDGELASYVSRLASLECVRDSLAEELVKMTEECERLRAESLALRGLRAEFDSLRLRHTAALELMGERDEELEELRADIVDLKEMYREQVDLLVNKIQNLGVLSAA